MITRTTVTDDDGSGTTGTIGDQAWLTILYDTLDARWSRFTYTSTGGQNNLDVDEADLVLLNSASDSAITGLQAPVSPAKPGKITIFKNVHATSIFTFAHNSGSSSAGNKFFNPVTSAAIPVAPGGAIAYQYDDVNSRWNYLWHDQGAWITPTFAAGNFTGLSAMTWTVGSGDVTTYASKLDGRRLTVAWSIDLTTVGGTPSSALQIAIPGGFTSTKTMANAITVNDNNGGFLFGFAQAAAAAVVISVFRSALATWSASTDLTSVRGELAFEVT